MSTGVFDDIVDDTQPTTSGVFDDILEDQSDSGEETVTPKEAVEWGLEPGLIGKLWDFASRSPLELLPEEIRSKTEYLGPSYVMGIPRLTQYLFPKAVRETVMPYHEALVEQARGLSEFSTSPKGAALTATGAGLLGTIPALATGGYFVGESARALGEEAAPAAGVASVVGTPQEQASAYTAMALTGLIPAAPAIHMAFPGKAAVPRRAPVAPSEKITFTPEEKAAQIKAMSEAANRVEVAMEEVGESGEMPMDFQISLMDMSALERELIAARRREPTTAEIDYIELLEKEIASRGAPATVAPETTVTAAQPTVQREMQLYDRKGPITVIERNEATGMALVRDAKDPAAPLRETPISEIYQTPKRGMSAEERAYREAERKGMEEATTEEATEFLPPEEVERAERPLAPGALEEIYNRQDLEAVAEELRGEGIDVGDIVEDQRVRPGPGGELPAGGNTFYVDTEGKVHASPTWINEWLRETKPENRRRAIKAALGEEWIHQEASKLFPGEVVERLWNGLSRAERALVVKGYGREGNPFQMGHEYLRRAMQRLLRMDRTELVQPSGLKWLTLNALDLIERATVAIRRRLPTKAGRELNQMLTRLEGNVRQARATKQGAAPAAAKAPLGSFFKRPEEAPEHLREAFRVWHMSPADFMQAFRGAGRSLTGSAWRQGDLLRSEDDVRALIHLRDSTSNEMKDAMAKGAMDAAQVLGNKAQYYSEAIQRATGQPASKVQFYRRQTPDYQPSVPMSREALARLEEDVRANPPTGDMNVEVRRSVEQWEKALDDAQRKHAAFLEGESTDVRQLNYLERDIDIAHERFIRELRNIISDDRREGYSMETKRWARDKMMALAEKESEQHIRHLEETAEQLEAQQSISEADQMRASIEMERELLRRLRETLDSRIPPDTDEQSFVGSFFQRGREGEPNEVARRIMGTIQRSLNSVERQLAMVREGKVRLPPEALNELEKEYDNVKLMLFSELGDIIQDNYPKKLEMATRQQAQAMLIQLLETDAAGRIRNLQRAIADLENRQEFSKTERLKAEIESIRRDAASVIEAARKELPMGGDEQSIIASFFRRRWKSRKPKEEELEPESLESLTPKQLEKYVKDLKAKIDASQARLDDMLGTVDEETFWMNQERHQELVSQYGYVLDDIVRDKSAPLELRRMAYRIQLNSQIEEVKQFRDDIANNIKNARSELKKQLTEAQRENLLKHIKDWEQMLPKANADVKVMEDLRNKPPWFERGPGAEGEEQSFAGSFFRRRWKPAGKKEEKAPELPLAPMAPGETRPTGEEMGAGPVIPPPSPNELAQAISAHIESGKPSFERFSEAMVRKYGEQVRPMLAENWRDQIWDNLTKASGKNLDKMVKSLGVSRRMGRLYSLHKIPIGDAQEAVAPVPKAVAADPEFAAWKVQANLLRRRGALDLSEAEGRKQFAEMGREELGLRRELRRPDLSAERRQSLENRRMELETVLRSTTQLRRLGGARVTEFETMERRQAAAETAEVPEKQVASQKIRLRAIATVGEKLMDQTLEQGQKPIKGRSTVEPEDIAWEREQAKGSPPWFEVKPSEQNDPRLPQRLIQGGSVAGKTASVTHRITMVRDNMDGSVHALSTFVEGTGLHRIYDPAQAARHGAHAVWRHVNIRDLLARRTGDGRPRYTVLASMLVRDPVQAFHQRFVSEAEWRQKLADPAYSAMARMASESIETAERSVWNPETEQYDVVKPEPEALEGSIYGREAFMTDAEARAVYEHFAGEDLTSRQQVADLFDQLIVDSRFGTRPSAQVIRIANALDKMFRQIRADNPRLSPEETQARVLDWIYENAGTEATRTEFVQRAMGRFAEPPGEVPAPGARVPAAGAGRVAPSAPNVPRGTSAEGAEELGAFFRPAAKKSAEIAEKVAARPLQAYSEWMVDRIARTGGAMSKVFANSLNSIITRQRELYGSLTPALDRALKLAGQLNAGTRWLHGLTPATARSATVRVVDAIEGKIPIPPEAQRVVSNAQQSNFESAQMLQPVVPGFRAGGAFQRNINAYGYDVISEGRGQVWDDWTLGLAAVNGLPVFRVRNFFRRWQTALNEPGAGAAGLERVNQDFARIFPNIVTHVKVGEGALAHWEPIMHADLFNYLQNAAMRASHVRAFREVYPTDSPMLRATLRTVRNELPSHVRPDLDGVIRALQGHPTDAYANGFLAPSSITGQALRFINQTAGNLMARIVLTGQMMTQAGETIAGATPAFLGYDNYVRALARVKQIYPQLELQGAVNRVVYDMSFDPSRKIRSISRIAGNVVSRVFQEPFLNELQEAASAATAQVVAERLQAGNVSAWERSMLPVTFRAMGFTPSQATAMMAGDPVLLQQFRLRSASWLTSGNKAIAEGSRLGANRLFNSVFRFQSYPMMKTNQLLRLLRVAREAYSPTGNARQRLAASRMLGRFLFHGVVQGALTIGIASLFTEGWYGTKIRKQEATDEPASFVTEAFLATMSGPLYLVWRGARDKGLLGVGEQATRTVFPYTMTRDLIDMAQGAGPYKDLDSFDRIGRYLSQKVPGSRPIVTALAAVGLAEKNVKLDTAMRAYFRWRRQTMGFKEQASFEREDERSEFRTAMKKAVKALQNNNLNAYRAAISDAATAPGTKRGAVKASLRARRLLQYNGRPLDADQLESLRQHIGDEPVQRLQYFDHMLERASEGAMLPPYD